MRRQRAALTVGQLGFLKFGHATVPAGVQRERRGQAELFAPGSPGQISVHSFCKFLTKAEGCTPV